jgi:hypothetical protein
LGTDLRAVRPTAVAKRSERKRDFQESAAKLFLMPSQIAERNQPPAARPTARLLSRNQLTHTNQTLTDIYFIHRFGASRPSMGCKDTALSLQRERSHPAINLQEREA